ncbi:D-alanyl-D-alanine carboxypeptidase/D-alanyl-D-alanine-endopeptidase [Kitasatospora sp. NPDC094015]|uniref:D-alanyl-D-alanine carboxypeptidase/D-alanyl-D-alanine endopeptidase n=1 Tax=Kitasatospora sp. NPDC094015 TaxID=3155205 RepID=UPI003319D75A
MLTLPARLLSVPLAAVLVALVPAGSAPGSVERPPGAARPLAADLDGLWADARLTGAQVSALVTDPATGEVLYEHAPGALLLPASTQKTVTAAAALDLLGPDHRFRTDVLAAGTRSGATLDGDLVLLGGGDPTLLPADLDGLAAEVADSGVRSVTGGLVADATRYDDVPLGPNWAWDDQAAYYSPQISALTLTTDEDYDPGTVRLTVTPGSGAGRPATVRVTPAEAPVHVTGQIRTGPAGGERAVDVARRPGGNELVVSGSVPAGAEPGDEWIAVDRPALLAATVFATALARHGVTLAGPVTEGPAPRGAGALASHDSAPLSTLMIPFLKLSNNGIAEHLVKEIGKVRADEGSWAAGTDQVRAFLHGSGLEDGDARQVDGSGLSRHNLLSARRLAALLQFARRQSWFTPWYEALPVAGDTQRMVGGTLTNRLRGTVAEGRVHAKTGSMTGVDALTGYLERPGAGPLAFTVLVNNFAGDSPRPVIDAFVLRLAGDTSARPAAAGPADRTAGAAGAAGRTGHDWENACLTGARC